MKGNFEGFGFNLALFKQILKGFQSNVFQGTGFVLGNAEKQSTKGIELDMTASPTKNLTFTGSLTYLDPKYDLFTGGSAFNPATNNVGPANLTGLTPSGISKYSVAVGGTWTVPFGNEQAVIFHIDYAHNSAYKIAQGLPYKASPESLNASVSLDIIKGLELTALGPQPDRAEVQSGDLPGRRAERHAVGLPQPAADLWRDRPLQVLSKRVTGKGLRG